MIQCPIRCPYIGLNLTFSVGVLPVVKGAVRKCPLCRPYTAVFQGPMMVSLSSSENGMQCCIGFSYRRENMMKCPMSRSSNGEVPLQWM